MPEVTTPAHKAGDCFVDYEEKVFPVVKAEPGEKALVTFHTVAFEGSIGLVNLLQATRLLRKGFETSVLLYGPGITLGIQRSFPKIGDEPFPGLVSKTLTIRLASLLLRVAKSMLVAFLCKHFTVTANLLSSLAFARSTLLMCWI